MNMEELMSLMKQNGAEMDPTISLLAQMMNNKQTETEPHKEPVELKPEIDRSKLIRKMKLLNHENKQLRNGLDQLLALNDHVARLLGACHDCFGKDPDCSMCKGQGYPGFYDFDKDMFLEFIGLCLTKISKEQGN